MRRPSPDRLPGTMGGNWLDAPHSEWAVWHLDQLAPTAPVAAGRNPRPLSWRDAGLNVAEVPLTRFDGSTGLVGQVLAETQTDAFLVAHDGQLVHEEYGHEGAESARHAVLSVTKSLVGCVAGVLAAQGRLELTARVRDYLPELTGSGYADATVRHLLDMRSGVRFVEAYTDPTSDINQLDRRLVDIGLRAFLQTLEQERPHGGAFRYRSSETDVLGWVCERATGQAMPTLISELIWVPMGAELDAYMSCDLTGMAVHDGGLAAAARDLLRFGLMLADGGRVPDPAGTGEPRQVVPAKWLRDAWGVDSDIRSAFAESPSELTYRGGWYRNQFWFRPSPGGDVLLCLGIHGQLIYVCRRTRTVCVKLSHWDQPVDLHRGQDTLRVCDTLGAALSRDPHEPPDRAGGLPGVAAGHRRGGLSARHVLARPA